MLSDYFVIDVEINFENWQNLVFFSDGQVLLNIFVSTLEND